MDNTKAKQAVDKAKVAKAMLEMAAAQAAAEAPINPEIAAANPALQPPDGLLNPRRPMGVVNSGPYSPGNMIGGYNLGYGQFVNPEA